MHDTDPDPRDRHDDGRSPRHPVPAVSVAVLLAAKAALVVLLLVGVLWPGIGSFAGKGMGFRLALFLPPTLVVPAWWAWRSRGGRRGTGRYPVALDLGLTVPFLADTVANAAGIYGRFAQADDVVHLVSWVVLVGGVTTALAGRAGRDRLLLWLAGTGIGAVVVIAWEIAEYLLMRAGVGGLRPAYGDTLSDLALSTIGGALGALWAADAQGRRARRNRC